MTEAPPPATGRTEVPRQIATQSDFAVVNNICVAHLVPTSSYDLIIFDEILVERFLVADVESARG